MAIKAAIDFGNSNTAAAVWNDRTSRAEVLSISTYSESGTFLIPSVISYEPDGRFYIGAQAAEKASESGKCFRWMKRYINLRSPYSLRIGTERIDASRAAEDFLRAVLAAVFEVSPEKPDELMVTVPVEAFEHYSEWLMSGMRAFEDVPVRLIDEATAAAAGYGMNVHSGDSLLIVDFGGSTLQAVCVSVTGKSSGQGRCCRVLGKAGINLGGMTLDRWIYEEALKRFSISENDPQIRSCSGELLRYCETIKKTLSNAESTVFDFFPDKAFPVTRADLDELMRSNGLTDMLDTVVKEALRTAGDHGLQTAQLTAVIPVGGSCLIPLIRNHLETCFPNDKVVRGEPLGAVARGAAVIAGGMDIYDSIQHDYAIRASDPQSGAYVFRTIVPKGTGYPAKQVGPRMKLKASFDGQTHYGIAVYELKEENADPVASEIFFDADGSVHVMPLTEDERRAESLFWINERDPLFLSSDTPGEKGTPRFEVTFGIDPNKFLTVSAVDLFDGREIFSAYPVVRLI